MKLRLSELNKNGVENVKEGCWGKNPVHSDQNTQNMLNITY